MMEDDRNIKQEQLDSMSKSSNEDSMNSVSESIKEDGLSKESQPSTVFLSTHTKYKLSNQNGDIYGVSMQGRYHNENGIPCQDYHIFKELGDGWAVFVIADGAGSSTQSHRGAKMNCEIGVHLIEMMVTSLKWKERDSLPSQVEWQVNFTSLCRTLKDFIISKISTLKEPVEIKDFNATFLTLIVTPNGMLSGHIGDGRMGYKDTNGLWHSLMVPHKGDEPNQTVFLLSAWDKPRVPALRMSGVYVPETRISIEFPSAVCLLSDGNENASWECTQWIENEQRYADKNHPFANYWDKLIIEIAAPLEEEKFSRFVSFIDKFNEASRIEGDDRTVLLGTYSVVNQEETIIAGTDDMHVDHDAPESLFLEKSDEND